MSKILLIVATVLILISAALGFLTKAKVQGLRQEIASKDGQISQKDAEVAKARSDMKMFQEEAAANNAKLEQSEADLAAAQKALESAKGELAAAQKTVEDGKAEIDKLNTAIASYKTSGTPPMPEASTDTAELQTKLRDTETQLAEARQLNDSLTRKVNDMTNQMATLKERAERHDRQQIAKGLEGQVLAVNRAWNFVVISIGDRQGVVPRAEMIVVRDGEMVGKVRITSVEPSTSIADVVPGSISKGGSLRPGDRVIYQGS
jgi:peptidoglycan hydrolase CwlO-like protein